MLVENWSQAKECVIGKNKETNALNNYLNTVRVKIFQIHRELEISYQPISANIIMDHYYGKGQRTVLDVFREHNEKCQALVGKEYVAGTIRKFNTSLLYLKEYIQEQYKDDDMLLQEIDQEFVRNYEFFLKIDKNCQNNSALKHIKNFRKIIRIAIGNEWIRKDPFYGLHFKEEEVNIDFLTNEELDMLRKKEFSIQRLEQVRDIFVFCCFTGLAFVDVYQLTAEYLIKDNQGMLWIRKSRQKTKEMCNIPVLSAAKDILDKYEEHAMSNESGFLLPVLSNQITT